VPEIESRDVPEIESRGGPDVESPGGPERRTRGPRRRLESAGGGVGGADRPASGSDGPASGRVDGPASGREDGPASGKARGPASGPFVWPVSGKSRPALGKVVGPASGKKVDGPASGQNGPASGQNGPASGQTAGLPLAPKVRKQRGPGREALDALDALAHSSLHQNLKDLNDPSIGRGPGALPGLARESVILGRALRGAGGARLGAGGEMDVREEMARGFLDYEETPTHLLGSLGHTA
jgi:hypothetical protein